MRLPIIFTMLAALCVAAPVRATPSGIYSLDQVVDAPYVDGVAARVFWDDLEPVEGAYDFSGIDAAIHAAEAVGQKVTLATIVGIAPEWLLIQCETFIHINGSTKCLPWDGLSMWKMNLLAKAMSAHTVDGVALKDHPAIAQVASPINGIQSIRLPNAPPGYTVEDFTRSIMLSLRIWQLAFPDKPRYVGLFGAPEYETSEAIREEIIGRYGDSVSFFMELLTGESPQLGGGMGDLIAGVDGRTGVMFQACGAVSQQDGVWAKCNWTEPQDSIDNMLSHGFEDFGATYFEIYRQDLQDPQYAEQLQLWHDFLQ